MLVLSRKINEAVVFPELGIRIVIVEVRGGNSVKIGIEADKRHTILREELTSKNTAPPAQGSTVNVDTVDVSTRGVG